MGFLRLELSPKFDTKYSGPIDINKYIVGPRQGSAMITDDFLKVLACSTLEALYNASEAEKMPRKVFAKT